MGGTADAAELMEAVKEAVKEVRNMELKEYSTRELVEELEKREGVKAHLAEPYRDLTVNVNGPALVLVVID